MTDQPDSKTDTLGVSMADMFTAERAGDFKGAALAALSIADEIGTRSAEGALVYTQRAQVYATLDATLESELALPSLFDVDEVSA